MNYVTAVLGNAEIYLPVTDKFGKMMRLAHKRLNFNKRIAKMRKSYVERIETTRIDVSSDFIYMLEDVLDENGYPDVIHEHFGNFTVEERKVLYELLREDKTIRFLVKVRGYEEEWLRKTVATYFETLSKKII